MKMKNRRGYRSYVLWSILSSHRVENLRLVLSRHGVSEKGSKKDLVDRLFSKIQAGVIHLNAYLECLSREDLEQACVEVCIENDGTIMGLRRELEEAIKYDSLGNAESVPAVSSLLAPALGERERTARQRYALFVVASSSVRFAGPFPTRSARCTSTASSRTRTTWRRPSSAS